MDLLLAFYMINKNYNSLERTQLHPQRPACTEQPEMTNDYATSSSPARPTRIILRLRVKKTLQPLSPSPSSTVIFIFIQPRGCRVSRPTFSLPLPPKKAIIRGTRAQGHHSLSLIFSSVARQKARLYKETTAQPSVPLPTPSGPHAPYNSLFLRETQGKTKIKKGRE